MNDYTLYLVKKAYYKKQLIKRAEKTDSLYEVSDTDTIDDLKGRLYIASKRDKRLQDSLDSYHSGYSRVSDAYKKLKDIEANNSSQANLMATRGKNIVVGTGAGIGAGIGGLGGYYGSNWINKKLGLTGRKALAMQLLGTAAGTALGGTGGYYGGKLIGNRAFKPDLQDVAEADKIYNG